MSGYGGAVGPRRLCVGAGSGWAWAGVYETIRTVSGLVAAEHQPRVPHGVTWPWAKYCAPMCLCRLSVRQRSVTRDYCMRVARTKLLHARAAGHAHGVRQVSLVAGQRGRTCGPACVRLYTERVGRRDRQRGVVGQGGHRGGCGGQYMMGTGVAGRVVQRTVRDSRVHNVQAICTAVR